MSTLDVLVELLAPPPIQRLRAVVEASSGGETQRWHLDVDRREGSWHLEGVHQAETQSWDASERVFTGGSERNVAPTRSLWQLPAPSPVRMVVPRLWPIWGRTRALDQHELSSATRLTSTTDALARSMKRLPVRRFQLVVTEAETLEVRYEAADDLDADTRRRVAAALVSSSSVPVAFVAVHARFGWADATAAKHRDFVDLRDGSSRISTNTDKTEGGDDHGQAGADRADP